MFNFKPKIKRNKLFVTNYRIGKNNRYIFKNRMKRKYLIIVLSIIIGGTVFIFTAKDKYYGCVIQQERPSINGRHMLFTEVWYRNECQAYWRDEIGLCDRIQEAEQELKNIKDEK